MVACVATSLARADDADHIVINVVNGYVYVSLGTRDGAAVGDAIELSTESGVAIGTLELDLCGEVICRARLAKGLVGKVARGMRVGARQPIAPIAEEQEPKVEAPSPVSTKLAAEPKHAPNEPVMGPDVIPYREPIPRGYELNRRSYSGLVALGWVGMSVTYGITALVGLADDDGTPLLIPVLGPLIYAAGTTNNSYGRIDSTPLILSTLLQGGSLICLIAGYTGEKRLVRTGSKASVAVMPVVTRDGAFFGVVGRF